MTVEFTPSDGSTERFVVDGYGREVGVVDTKTKRFAAFHGKDAVDLKRRLEYVVGRLNDGTDTPTGYVWEEMK